jgi:SAM-dependent methyltransferase
MESRGKGWRCDSATIAKLNRIFGTSVELQNTTMDEANFSEEYFDRIFSISVIEHVPEEEREALMMKAYRCLKKGGYFVLTVDLFLDLAPFSERHGNQWGNNANIKALIEAAPFRLISGNTAEMNGFPAFRPEVIKENLENFFQGNYPVLCQCLVLQK